MVGMKFFRRRFSGRDVSLINSSSDEEEQIFVQQDAGNGKPSFKMINLRRNGNKKNSKERNSVASTNSGCDVRNGDCSTSHSDLDDFDGKIAVKEEKFIIIDEKPIKRVQKTDCASEVLKVLNFDLKYPLLINNKKKSIFEHNRPKLSCRKSSSKVLFDYHHI